MAAMQNRHTKLPVVKLNPTGTHRCLYGHSWVFDNEFRKPEEIEPGAEVDVADARGRFIGRGYYNPASKIAIRIFTHSSRSTLTTDFLIKRITQAREARKNFLPESEPRRIVFSEGDRLPGLVADMYGETIVVQILTLGMDQRRDAIVEALVKTYAPAGILERSDVTSRSREGLEPRTGVLYGQAPDRIACSADGVRFIVHPRTGHKTGTYLDQRFNRRRFAEFAPGARILDAFAYHGLFGLYAGCAGASEVTAIESSDEACRELKENADANGRPVELMRGNVFEILKLMESEGRRFELISLDPPSFTKSLAASSNARRGYKEINLRAMRLLSDHGVLFTSSCSFHTDRESFIDALAEAAHDSRRVIQLLELRSASPDHPVRMEIPETDYLKCAVLQARG